MNKKKKVLILIECDIISTKLTSTLNGIGIDVSLYESNIHKVIFRLLGIKKEARTDQFYFKYFELIRQGQFINVQSKSDLRRLALKVYKSLFIHV